MKPFHVTQSHVIRSGIFKKYVFRSTKIWGNLKTCFFLFPRLQSKTCFCVKSPQGSRNIQIPGCSSPHHFVIRFCQQTTKTVVCFKACAAAFSFVFLFALCHSHVLVQRIFWFRSKFRCHVKKCCSPQQNSANSTPVTHCFAVARNLQVLRNKTPRFWLD